MGYVGLDGFCQFATGATYTGFGNVSGGEIGVPEQDLSHHEGIGGQDLVAWGMVTPNASIESIYKGESAMLESAARTVFYGLPPVVTVWGGICGVATQAHLMTGAYIDHVAVECGGIGEPVNANYDIIGLFHSYAIMTQGSQAAAAFTAPFVWPYGAVTIGIGTAASAAYNCQNWTAELSNNLRAESDQDLKTAAVRRMPQIVEPGNEVIGCSLSLKAPLNMDMYGDAPIAAVTAAPISVAFLIGNGYTSQTITLRQLYLSSEPTPFVAGDGTIVWDYDLESIHNALAAAAATAWTVSALA